MAIKDEYLTVTDVTQLLGVTRQTVAKWIRDGKLPAERLGKRTYLIPKDSLPKICPTCGRIMPKEAQNEPQT